MIFSVRPLKIRREVQTTFSKQEFSLKISLDMRRAFTPTVSGTGRGWALEKGSEVMTQF